jgi:FMN phosphatase YigB (HAD superfamily)
MTASDDSLCAKVSQGLGHCLLRLFAIVAANISNDRIYLYALEQVGKTASETVAIEDSKSGVKTLSSSKYLS